MSKSEQEFLEEVRKAFVIEAEEHLQTITSGLIDIEKKKDSPERQGIIEEIYRAVHNLKGSARFVNMTGIGAVCQSMESIFSAIKKGALTPAAADFDVMQLAVDCMSRMLASPDGGTDAEETGKLVERLDLIAASGKNILPSPSALLNPDAPLLNPHSALRTPQSQILPPPSAPSCEAFSVATPGKPAADIIRISMAKLDSILLQAEELISIKLAGEQRLSELAEIMGESVFLEKELEKARAKALTLRRLQEKQKDGSIDKFSVAMASPLADSPDWGLARMRELNARLSGLRAGLQGDLRATGILVDKLLEETKTVLLQPFSTLLQTFPKTVRDISREQNKDVELLFTGGEIETDKRILEQIKEPLVHLLRNAIDHGIEKPDQRLFNGKQPSGKISVDVSRFEGNRIQILVSDDGTGIDTAKLREVAVRRGIMSREKADALDDKAAMMLIFQSGISTSTLITDLSGRGLGMAIVHEAVDRLGGRISIETEKGLGTTFRITLPLTLATFRGMLLWEYGQCFVIPMANIEHVLRIRKEDVRTMENRETIMINGTPLSLLRLGAVLGLEPGAEPGESRPLLFAVALKSGACQIAFSFDSLLHEQEILIKGLGQQLVRVRNIAGATVLGSGKVVPVLNVADLFKSAVRTGLTVSAPQELKGEILRKSILVVEDSITSRMLLKNILASAGFDVHIAVDGVEAWTSLKERQFDAVVSDIEMPRMNGFELTAKIRADAKLAELPVVLLTALESRPDREHGIEVGADAYIVKSSFDQSNLLDVVRRLV
jgi:two-component system chemotaxis sensor kinase CheA